MGLSLGQVLERRNYIGGSDAGKIVGVSDWGSALSVYLDKKKTDDQIKHEFEAIEKLKEVKTETGELFVPAMMGDDLEPLLAQKFTQLTGKNVRRVNDSFVHPTYDYIRANIDRRVVGEDAILEIKTAGAFKNKLWVEDNIPDDYLCQVMHYLAVTGAAYAYIICLIGGQKIVWKKIYRDENLINLIIQKEVLFWTEFVMQNKMPVSAASDLDRINEKFKYAVEGFSIALLPEHEEMIAERFELKSKISVLEEAVNGIDAKLKMFIGEHEIAGSDRFLITWKNQVREGIDIKALKSAEPAIFKQYEKETVSRVFRVTSKK